MQRLHFLRWLALAVAAFSFQCIDSATDCHSTLTCVEDLPTLGPDCTWHYPDGSPWQGGPRRTSEGRWLWPNGKETLTQDLECPVNADAGQGDAGLGAFVDCPRVPCDQGLSCEESTGRCVQCLTDETCAGVVDPRGALPRCDPRRHECVVCLGDDDCEQGLNCKVDPSSPANNRCVDCVKQVAEQCPSGEVCDLGSNKCTTRCTGTDQCRAPKSVCSNVANQAESGLCVQCITNGDCSAPTPQCNVARKECVECVDSCAGGLVCNAANRCVECVSDAQCAGGDRPHCDVASNSCVACTTNAQCTGRDASKCNAVTHVCEACTDDTQCEPDFPVCNPRGRCVSCRDDSNCASTPATPLCDVASGSCVGCLNNGNCDDDPTLARCENNTCQFCTLSAQCTGKFGNRNLCSLSNGACVQCTNNQECNADANASRCNTSTGLCARCQSDTDCNFITGKRACTLGNNARCAECVNATHCTNNPNGPACNTTTNTCVQCVADADCKTPGASRCFNNQCVACTGDANCSHILSGQTTLGVCDTSGGAGVCVQCTGPKRAACGANVCNSLTKVCSPFAPGSAILCTDCVSDAHCRSDQRCVLETFAGTEIGYSCFPADQAGACPERPFSGLSSVTTIDGVAATVCSLRRTTCAGVNEQGSSCAVNADCGETGVDDGRCDTTIGQCSIPCTNAVLDCPEASTCGTFCQFQG